MNQVLFKRVHGNYIKTANSLRKQYRSRGFTYQTYYKGEWINSLYDPRFKVRFDPFREAKERSETEYLMLIPKWFSAIRLVKNNDKTIQRYVKRLKVDHALLSEINSLSKGLWIEYFRVYRHCLIAGGSELRDLSYLTLLAPNIFTVAREIVKDPGFSVPVKHFDSVDTLYEIDESAQDLRERKEYEYLTGMKKRIFSRKNDPLKRSIFEFTSKLKHFNWDLKTKPSIYPAEFPLSKIECEIYVVFEIFKMSIAPKLKFKKLRNTNCKACNRLFNPYREIFWFGTVPPKICDICMNMARNGNIYIHEVFDLPVKQIKENCINGVKSFEATFGYIPLSALNRERILQDLFNPTSLSQNEINLIKSLATLPRVQTAKEYFGSWAHLLGEAEVLERTRTVRGGYRSIGSDGHLCLSVGERLICESLFGAGIKHSKEPLYPIDTILNPAGRLRADFKAGNSYIEFAGRMSIPEYAERMQQKRKLAKKLKIKLLVMESVDEESLHKMFQYLKKSK